MQKRYRKYNESTAPGSFYEFLKSFYNIFLGDFGNFDSKLFNNQTIDADIYIWVFKFFATMYLFVILMNLIISFIGNIFSEILSKKK